MVAIERPQRQSIGPIESIALGVSCFAAATLALRWIDPSVRAAIVAGVSFPLAVLLGLAFRDAVARVAATPALVFALAVTTGRSAMEMFPNAAPPIAPIAIDDDHHTSQDDSRIDDAPPDLPPCDPGPAIDRAHAIAVALTPSGHADGALCGPGDRRYYAIELPSTARLTIEGAGAPVAISIEDAEGNPLFPPAPLPIRVNLARGRSYLQVSATERGAFALDIAFSVPSPP